MGVKVGERGDRERDIAASEREQVAILRAVAMNVADPEERAGLKRDADARESDADLHDRLADVYDREDG